MEFFKLNCHNRENNIIEVYYLPSAGAVSISRVGGPHTVLLTHTLPERWAQALGLQPQVHRGGRLRTSDARRERLWGAHRVCATGQSYRS